MIMGVMGVTGETRVPWASKEGEGGVGGEDVIMAGRQTNNEQQGKIGLLSQGILEG